MSTPAPTTPKSRYLQSLSNIDLAHRNKKVITTPTRPPVPPPSRVSKDAAVVVPKAKPLGAAEPASSKPAHVRRIYDREFLLKFKYAYTDFPPGVPTPSELMEQYNKDLEIRDSMERQAMLVSSSLSAQNNAKPAVAVEKQSVLAPGGFVGRGWSTTTSTTVGDKEKVREKKLASASAGGPKFRMPSSKSSISRLAMFSSPNKVETAPAPVHNNTAGHVDDKENRVLPALENVLVSAAAGPVKKQKVATIITTPAIPSFVTVPVPAPQPVIIDTPKKATDFAATAIADIKPEPVSAVVPQPVAVASAHHEESVEELTKKMKTVLREEDERRLSQRQKQIEYGKNTLGYANYVASIAKSKRKRDDPKTPNKHQICSKRSWDGQIRKWRRQLHFYDPKGVELAEDDSEMNNADDIEQDADANVPTIDTSAPLVIEASAC